MRYILLGIILGSLLAVSHPHGDGEGQHQANHAACHRAHDGQVDHLYPPQWSLAPVDEPDWWDAVVAEAAICFPETLYRELYIGYAHITAGPLIGITWEDEDGALRIVLDPSRILGGFEQAWEILVHEWAHAALWDTPEILSHGPLWGVKYAELYRLGIDPGPQQDIGHDDSEDEEDEEGDV